MCGRFAASASTEEIVETFAVELVADEPSPTFNAAPTDPVPAVLERVDKESGRAVRKLVTPRWGLVPSWSKSPSGAARLINARAETVASKPAFARAFAARRCLIPADGYYEWQTLASPGRKAVKQPWFVRAASGDMMAMAGLYEFLKDPTVAGPDAWLTTCTVITTEATDALGHIHDRMPMVVRPEDWAAWLDPHATDPQHALALLHVTEGAEIDTFPVSMRVNTVGNDGPDLVLPLP
ncbi:MAG: SOS response-associated peptidase [Actinomycetes bacterium]